MIAPGDAAIRSFSRRTGAPRRVISAEPGAVRWQSHGAPGYPFVFVAVGLMGLGGYLPCAGFKALP